MKCIDNIIESLQYAIINLLGSFITILFNVVHILLKYERCPSGKELFGLGEGIIICIPLCITILYVLYQNKNVKGSKNSILFWVNFFLVLIAAYLYSHLRTGEISYNDNMFTLSIIMIILTFLSLFFSKFMENKDIDTEKVREDDLNTLEEKVNRIP